jgi:hypothetical protein
MTSTSHQEAYQDINPFLLVGKTIQIQDQQKKVESVKGKFGEKGLTINFYDGTTKNMAEIPIEKLEAAT